MKKMFIKLPSTDFTGLTTTFPVSFRKSGREAVPSLHISLSLSDINIQRTLHTSSAASLNVTLQNSAFTD